MTELLLKFTGNKSSIHLMWYAAFPPDDSCYFVTDKTEFHEEHVPDLENWIDEYTSQLPPLRNFIIPVIIYFTYLLVNKI